MTAGDNRFDPSLVGRVLAHVNRCHRVENLFLARMLEADLRRAWVAGLDGQGMDLLGETPRGPVVLRLDFERPATNLAEAGEELSRLYRTACRPRR